MTDQAEPPALRVIALLAVLAGTLGLSACSSGESRNDAASATSSATPSASSPSSTTPTPASPSPAPTCVRGDREWLDRNLLGRSVTSYLPIELGGPPKPCKPVTVHIAYFDVSFTTARDGGKLKHGYTVETVDRQRLKVDGSGVVQAKPPSGGSRSTFACTGHLVTMSLGKQVAPGDIKTISWSQYGGSGAIGNVGIAFKKNTDVVRYDLRAPTETSAC
ncbi:hypothetical protein AB0H82_10045 [Streptomyces sp. NPDC050732]|uniref:hypothetical protein n=1 Tax=Streptomyces sp. NPDC050732 TaxID=3154632 RepID=UPI00342DC5CF